MDPIDDLIPSDRIPEYESQGAGRELNTMIPHGKTPQQFVEGLAHKFKSVSFFFYFSSIQYFYLLNTEIAIYLIVSHTPDSRHCGTVARVWGLRDYIFKYVILFSWILNDSLMNVFNYM